MGTPSQSRTHGGVRNQLGQHFVHTGRIAPEVAGFLSQLQGLREQSDYDIAAVFNAAMAEEAIERAERFKEAALSVLRIAGYI